MLNVVVVYFWILKAYSEEDVKAGEKAAALAKEMEAAQQAGNEEKAKELEVQQKAEESKKGSAEADIKLGAKKVEEAKKQQQQNEELMKKQFEEREKKSETNKEGKYSSDAVSKNVVGYYR